VLYSRTGTLVIAPQLSRLRRNILEKVKSP
jgi:hypothetical protein